MFNSRSVLLVTVNEQETRATLEAILSVTNSQPVATIIDGQAYNMLGSIFNTQLIHTVSEMGTGGTGGSQETTRAAIDSLKPLAVISIGVAFGMNSTSQSIGEILVSRQLELYDLARIGARVIIRGDRPHASSRLVKYFTSFAHTNWRGARVTIGRMLSGDKLIDDLDYRVELQNLVPEAIGGEMEGAGVYAICQNRKIDWIVIKGVCDWADGNKGENTLERQKVAARNAAAFLAQCLKTSSLGDLLAGGTSNDSSDTSGKVVIKGSRNTRFSTTNIDSRSSLMVPAITDFYESSYYDMAHSTFIQNRLQRGVVLCGPRASGKTEVAYRLSSDFKAEYEYFFVVSCSNDGRTVSHQSDLAQMAGLQNGQANLDEILREIARGVSKGKRWLLVVDDVPDEKWVLLNLPTLDNLDLIVTSNKTEWTRLAKVHFDYLSEHETFNFIAHMSSGRVRRAEMVEIYKATNGMFWGVRQAVKFALKDPAYIKTMSYDGIFERSFHNVESESSKAMQLLELLSLLDGNSIPLALIARTAASNPQVSGSVASTLSDWISLSEVLALNGLIRFRSFTELNDESLSDGSRIGIVSVHGVIQQAVQKSRYAQVSLLQRDLFLTVAKAFSYDWSNQYSHANALPMWPHIQSILAHLLSLNLTEERPEFHAELLRVLEDATSFEYFNQNFSEALAYSNWARDLGVEYFLDEGREEYRTQVEWHHNRATILMQLGTYDEAIGLAKRAYELCEAETRLTTSEREHKVCGFIGCEGCVFRAAQRHSDAMESYTRALTRMARVNNVEQITLQYLVKVSKEIPDIFYWRPLHTFGGLLLNYAIELSHSGQLDDATRTIEIACECLTLSNMPYHVWTGIAHYYAWKFNELAGNSIRAELRRELALDVLCRPVPPFVCMGRVQEMRQDLGIIALKPLPSRQEMLDG